MDKLKPRIICEINIDNILSNIEVFRQQISKKTRLCAVIKADAYGHGSVEIAKQIKEKVDYFAVATAEEAIELRNNNIKTPILLLGYYPKNQIVDIINNNIEIALHSKESIDEVLEICQKHNLIAKTHIKLDTGMSRIGFTKENYIKDLESLIGNKYVDIIGVFSHFARADEVKSDFTDNQFDCFKEMVNNLEKAGFSFRVKHISNTSATLNDKYNLDMVRVGLGMYGYLSIDNIKNLPAKSLKPAMSIYSTIYQIKRIPKGTPVGYGSKYISEKDEWIATVPAGYADGISRNISNKDYKVTLENGEVATVVGNICMDQMMIRLDKKVPLFSKVYIFNTESKYNASYLADMSDTIVYEVLCSIQKRVPKCYIKGGNIISKIEYM